MVPNEALQFKGILQLLLYFQWVWIGIFIGIGVNFEWFMQIIFPEFSKNGICFDFMETAYNYGMNDQSNGIGKWSAKAYDIVMKGKANVVILYGNANSIVLFRIFLNMPKFKGTLQESKGKIWVLTAQMEIKPHPSYRQWNIEFFHGALSLNIHSNKVQGFQEFVQSRSPSDNKDDGFIKDFWALAFSCLFPNHLLRKSWQFQSKAKCPEKEKLGDLPQPYLETSMTGHSYSIYNAVYVVAHALHAMHVSKSRIVTTEGKGKELQKLQPWQVINLPCESCRIAYQKNLVGSQTPLFSKLCKIELFRKAVL